MVTRIFVALALLAAVAVRAEDEFRVVPGTETLIEGGVQEKLTVVTGQYQYIVRPPHLWSRTVDDSTRKIIFTSPSGKSAITIQFTKASPGTLPEEDALRSLVTSEHSGANIYWPPQGNLQAGIAPTNYKPGVYFDLVSVPTPHVVQRYRHAFVAVPTGTVEVALSSPDSDFEKEKPMLMQTLGAFRIEPVPAKP